MSTVVCKAGRRSRTELGTTGKKNTIHAALRAALRESASRDLMDRLAQSTEDVVNAMWEQAGATATVRGADEQALR